MSPASSWETGRATLGSTSASRGSSPLHPVTACAFWAIWRYRGARPSTRSPRGPPTTTSTRLVTRSCSQHRGVRSVSSRSASLPPVEMNHSWSAPFGWMVPPAASPRCRSASSAGRFGPTMRIRRARTGRIVSFLSPRRSSRDSGNNATGYHAARMFFSTSMSRSSSTSDFPSSSRTSLAAIA